MSINEKFVGGVDLKKYKDDSLQSLENGLNLATTTYEIVKEQFESEILKERRKIALNKGDVLLPRIPGTELVIPENYRLSTKNDHPGFNSPTKVFIVDLGDEKKPAYGCNGCGIVQGAPLEKSVQDGKDFLCYVCGETTGNTRYRMR